MLSYPLIMRPSSLGGGRILRRTLSVRLSVCPSVPLSLYVAPPSELQWHTCTFPHALRAAYRTAISAAQILVWTAMFQDLFTLKKICLRWRGNIMVFYERGVVWFIMWPSSLGGGRILRCTLSVRLSVCPSVPLLLPSVTSRRLANYNDTHVLFGTHRGPHIVRPSRPHKLVRLNSKRVILTAGVERIIRSHAVPVGSNTTAPCRTSDAWEGGP